MNAFERARSIAHKRRIIAHTNDGYTPGVYGHDKTLVIIDMQTSFLEDNYYGDTDHGQGSYPCYEIIPGICSIIQHAMIRGWGIIVVEYRDNGRTHEDILDTVSGYKHFEVVGKNQPDGGKEVLSRLEANPGWSTDILVCGIFGNCCVSQTVSGIFDGSDLAEVCVLEDLVYPDYEPHKERDEDRVTLGTLEELNICKEVEV